MGMNRSNPGYGGIGPIHQGQPHNSYWRIPVPTHSSPMGSIADTVGYTGFSSPATFYNGSMFSSPDNPPDFAPATMPQQTNPFQNQLAPPPAQSQSRQFDWDAYNQKWPKPRFNMQSDGGREQHDQWAQQDRNRRLDYMLGSSVSPAARAFVSR